METQFVCQKIMAKKVILQQCAHAATGNIPQPSYVSVDNVSACSDISYRALFTYILQHMPHSLELIQLCGVFFMNKALVNGSSIYWPIFNSI